MSKEVEGFGAAVGQGIGCFLLIIGIVILLNMGRVLDMIDKLVSKP